MIWQLFISFFRIGLFTFGGGYAMIPVIQHEVCGRRGWIAEQDFMDLLTLAQSAPGPISLNASVFVGYKVRGTVGALLSLLGVVLPSFAVILAVAVFFAGIRDNAIVDAAFRALRPAVVALIVAPILGFAKGMTWWMAAIGCLTALLVWYFSISPVLLLACGISVGVSYAMIQSRKEAGK